MKIEKLRNNHKKEIIIGTILLVVIGGALTYKLTHSKYRVTQSIDLGSGVINYKVPDFKIMAMYKNDGSGDVSIDSMPTSGYIINEEKTYCRTSSGNEVKGKIKTISGNHVISGLNKGDKCYLYFDINENITIGNNEIEYKAITPDFRGAATSDEGVYAANDGMYGGKTYYWRGAATTNHVIFANKCWRILRINGDKTIRLIYNGTVQSENTCFGNGSNADSIVGTGKAYNLSHNQSNHVGWTYEGELQRPTDNNSATPSNAKSLTETWYTNNLKSYESKIADGKFCNDRETGSGYTWTINGNAFYYGARERLETNKVPTFNCPSGDVYTLKVGAITADEVVFAGGNGENNTSYYLYNGQRYWTMTPHSWNKVGVVYVFYVAGEILYNSRLENANGIRPVINLKANTTFANSGTGTKSNPYVVQ